MEKLKHLQLIPYSNATNTIHITYTLFPKSIYCINFIFIFLLKCRCYCAIVFTRKLLKQKLNNNSNNMCFNAVVGIASVPKIKTLVIIKNIYMYICYQYAEFPPSHKIYEKVFTI